MNVIEIFKLFGSVMVDNKGANESLDETDKKAEKTGKSFGEMIGTAAKWGAAIVAGATAAGAGVFALVNRSAEALDVIDKLSERTGINREELQRWKYAADQSGADIGKLEVGIKKLSGVMDDATNGNEKAIKAFDQLGISVDDLKNKSQEDIFEMVMAGLGDMEQGAARNALGNDLLGKSYTELLPLLNAGSGGMQDLKDRADELGLVMSEESVKAAVVFGDTFADVKDSIGAVFTRLGVDLMPMFQKMLDWVLEHLPQIRATIGTAFELVGDVINLTTDAIRSLTRFFQEYWHILQPILLGIAAAALTFGIYSLAINASAIATGIWSTVTTVATAAGAAFGAVLAFITSPIGIVVIAIGLLVAAGVLLYKNWDEVSAFLSESWEWIASVAEEIWNSISEFFTKLWEDIKQLFTDTVNGIKETIVRVFNAVVDFFKEWGPLILAILTGPIGLLVLAIIKNWDTIKDKTIEIFTSVKDTVLKIWDGIVSGIKGAINGIIGSINSFIGGINSLKITVPSVDIPLIGKVGGFSVGLPNIPSIPKLAEGGDIWDDGAVMVGEEGPEILSGIKGARVTPLDHAEGGRTVNIFVELDGRTLVRAVGEPLVDYIRVKTGVRI